MLFRIVLSLKNVGTSKEKRRKCLGMPCDYRLQSGYRTLPCREYRLKAKGRGRMLGAVASLSWAWLTRGWSFGTTPRSSIVKKPCGSKLGFKCEGETSHDVRLASSGPTVHDRHSLRPLSSATSHDVNDGAMLAVCLCCTTRLTWR
jgi:hypothetical protein